MQNEGIPKQTYSVKVQRRKGYERHSQENNCVLSEGRVKSL